ncbi:LysE family translocator [Pseudophaeobacter sp. EL27]|uniref:LysE family translocator n=1 Tax=Pseudophaeobacter sp. EL27 TaxID=2107580 RepID=UPI000EFA6548|nr:LysE family translocator [Pseudophaeobacter sp. EL27]
MDFTLWLAFASASAALLLIPGPTVLLVLSYALSKGRQVAVASATLFTVLKWVGAAYLLWLGVKLWRSASEASSLEVLVSTDAANAPGVFGHTATVTALNPKSIAFFIAFVPKFIRPGDALTPQFVILIATFVGLAALNALAYALLADRLRLWISRPKAIANLTRVGGAALVAMGLATALLRRPAA